VKLTVTHEIDRETSKMIDALSNGWPMILSSLKTLLETGDSLDATKKWPRGCRGRPPLFQEDHSVYDLNGHQQVLGIQYGVPTQ